MQWATPTNVDNLFAARQSDSVVGVPATSMTYSVIKAMFKKENVSSSSVSLKLKSRYPFEVAVKPYPSKYEVPEKVIPRSMSCASSTWWASFTHDVDLCLWEFSESLTDRAYSRYVNLKPGAVHDCEHFVSLFNAKFFYAETKVSLAELVRICYRSRGGLVTYTKRFHARALQSSERGNARNHLSMVC